MIARPGGANETQLAQATGFSQLRVLVREVAGMLPGRLHHDEATGVYYMGE